MKFIYYYVWLGLANLHPYIAKSLRPINWVVIKAWRKTNEEQQTWKKNYSKSILEFPGGINDWYAFGITLGVILTLVTFLLFKFDLEVHFFKSTERILVLFIIIAAFSYYWIYFRNIDWLKEKINKVSKKYYIK